MADKVNQKARIPGKRFAFCYRNVIKDMFLPPVTFSIYFYG